MPKVRCFVAVFLDASVLEELDATQRLLKRRLDGAGLRWARVDQLHLTLLFLGDVTEDCLPEVESALRAACAGHRPLRLSLGRLGVFPAAGAPRVLWAGLQGEVDLLGELQAAVAAALARFTSREEPRVFHPHLTLARVRDETRPMRDFLAALREFTGPPPVPSVVRKVQLMRSDLGPSGARYTVLAEVPLD